MTERCYRLADKETVEVRGDAARDALLARGYRVVAPINCRTGTITAQADESEVARARREQQEFESLPEDERRQLRRQVGAMQVASTFPAADATWDAR
jgi:hypothetical protein